MLALIAVVALAITGVLAISWLWLLAGWWFFEHRRHRGCARRHSRGAQISGGWQR